MFTPSFIIPCYLIPCARHCHELNSGSVVRKINRSCFSRILVPKVAYRSQNHGHPALVPGGDNLVVPYRAPWLNSGCGTRLSRRDQTVRKREESIATYRTPLQRKSGFPSFPCGDP